jgi:hypothetical protein
MAILMVPADGEEQLYALRPLVTAARALAARGAAVMRFDYFGQGESDGDFESSTIRSRVENALFAWRFLADCSGFSPAMIGVRLGGLIAVAAALQLAVDLDVVLWDPVIDPMAYLNDLLRVNLAGQMIAYGKTVRDRNQLIADARAGNSVSVNGYALADDFITELASFDARAAMKHWGRRGLILTSRSLDPQVGALPAWTSKRVQSAAFWKEPKHYSTAPLPHLDPTMEWLALRGSNPTEG